MEISSSTDTFPVLVVLNPNAGRKQGLQQFTQIVQPALELSGTAFRLFKTTSQGHAHSYFEETVKKTLADMGHSFEANDSATSTEIQHPQSTSIPPLRVMVLGGDGTVHEIVNGILRGLAVDISSTFLTQDSKPRIELGVFPVGTGNAIATSLGILSVTEAMDRFLAGNAVPLRVVKVLTRSQEISTGSLQSWKLHAYTVVVNSFGLHCATVHDAEGYRSLGNARFKLAVLKNVALLKQYEGRLDLYGPVQRYDRELREMVPASDESTLEEEEDANPSLMLSGSFTYLMLTKQASLEPGFTPTPLASTSDDWLDVLAVQNVGRSEILQILGAAKNGQHIQHKHVEYYKAKVIELETPVKERLCVDGEFMYIEAGPQGRVRFEVMPQHDHPLFCVYSG
ncbi:hypothetical protein BGX28_006141 [Mortierella sp. GBA30]|nr:hypothetical protein BGX28_006141 [Mortierella sp. GBA30]